MEFALWNGKKISASDVSKDYSFETQVRHISNKELFCPDPNCGNPILKYCHGDKKDAYFAHICNENCDYGDYDKNTPSNIKVVCKSLYNHLSALGYNVQMEVKILPHHYTHILLTNDNGEQFAFELGNQRTSEKFIQKINSEYAKLNISVQWIVIDSLSTPDSESRVYYLKRHILNESMNNVLIIIEPETFRVGQYKIDENRYFISGREVQSPNYKKVYEKVDSLNALVFEKNEITFESFIENYSVWLDKKMRKFKERKAREEKIYIERIEKEQEERKRTEERLAERRRLQAEAIKNRTTNFNYPQYKPQPIALQPEIEKEEPKLIKPYEERKAEIVDKMNQTKEKAIDSSGMAWFKCTECGKIDEDQEFVEYGGKAGQTRGLCRECSKKSRK